MSRYSQTHINSHTDCLDNRMYVQVPKLAVQATPSHLGFYDFGPISISLN